MSAPRFTVGSRVQIKPGNVGFSHSAEPVLATIDEGNPDPYCFCCDNPECWEWPNILTDSGQMLYHISECQMEALP